jgi:S-DNA-T family DNA segregation ATPase FtsK/SpoIIIE
VNGIITSLLLTKTPQDLRLLMIDPKMLELPVYNGIPHLLMPVVTDPKVAAKTLRGLISEMERRYTLLARRGVRNIDAYHERLDEDVRDGCEVVGERLPYVVAVIDELADLMITTTAEVEEPIGRLAQTARAVGIHLIVATQRPSVDVLTGVIKANFPSRIAFQVASRTDSRTILDMNGAESLLGRGDMLFMLSGRPEVDRVHGAFVSDRDTERIVKFWRRVKPRLPQIDLEADRQADASSGADWDDPLFEDAARLVVLHQQGSASLLQRRLKVGYSRAARLVDMLEEARIVAPSEGSKAREVLVDEVRLEEVLRDREREALKS